jgi:hypothetical protein
LRITLDKFNLAEDLLEGDRRDLLSILFINLFTNKMFEPLYNIIHKQSKLTSKEISKIIKANELAFISGPVSLGSFKYQDRNFYFFGEKHFGTEGNCETDHQIKCKSLQNGSKSKVCYDFLYFLEKIFRDSESKNEYVDFFLESPFILKNIKVKKIGPDPNEDYISLIQNHFIDCLKRNKSKCKYKTLRLHYTDFRIQTTKDIVGINYLPLLFIKNFKKHKRINEKQKYIHFYNIVTRRLISKRIQKKLFQSFFQDNFYYTWFEIYKSLLRGFNRKKYHKQIKEVKKLFDHAFKYHKVRNNKNVHLVKSQLDSLREDNIKHNGQYMSDLIKKFVTNNYKNIDFSIMRRYWKEYIRRLRQSLIHPEDKNIFKDFNLDTLLELFIEIDTNLLDAYLLARMFRIFTSSKKYILSDIVMTYTGYYHTQNYIDFFRNVLGIKPDILTGPINKDLMRCIYSPKFKREFE